MPRLLSTTAAADTAITESVDEAFFAVIASDPDLLRAEFDELVDAAWDVPADPPAEPPEPEPPEPESAPGNARDAFRGGHRAGVVVLPREVSHSERSPP